MKNRNITKYTGDLVGHVLQFSWYPIFYIMWMWKSHTIWLAEKQNNLRAGSTFNVFYNQNIKIMEMEITNELRKSNLPTPIFDKYTETEWGIYIKGYETSQ